MLPFLGTLLLYDIFWCLRDRAEAFFTSVLIRETGRKRNRIFPIKRKKTIKAEHSFILTGKRRLKLKLLRTRKLMTLFLFEVHWPKYQDEQTL